MAESQCRTYQVNKRAYEINNEEINSTESILIYQILNRLPMRCSASDMFATDNVNSCTCVIRKSIYSLTARIFTLTNPIVKSIVGGDVYYTPALRNLWISLLYTT